MNAVCINSHKSARVQQYAYAIVCTRVHARSMPQQTASQTISVLPLSRSDRCMPNKHMQVNTHSMTQNARKTCHAALVHYADYDPPVRSGIVINNEKGKIRAYFSTPPTAVSHLRDDWTKIALQNCVRNHGHRPVPLRHGRISSTNAKEVGLCIRPLIEVCTQ